MTDQPATCPSTFVIPGESTVHRCDGNPGHTGVMHAAPGVAWGDGAAREEHPAEPIVLRLGRFKEVIDEQHDLLVGAVTLIHHVRRLHHATPDGSCCECKTTHPCTTAQLVGAGSITDMLKTIAATDPDSPHAAKPTTTL